MNQSNVAFHPRSLIPVRNDDADIRIMASFQLSTKNGSPSLAFSWSLRLSETTRHLGSALRLFHTSKISFMVAHWLKSFLCMPKPLLT